MSYANSNGLGAFDTEAEAAAEGRTLAASADKREARAPTQDDKPAEPANAPPRTGPRVIIKRLGADGLTDAERAAGKAPYNDAPAPAAPSANTVFTEDMAAAARARLKAKLGRLNSGLDPEMMMDGITLQPSTQGSDARSEEFVRSGCIARSPQGD